MPAKLLSWLPKSAVGWSIAVAVGFIAIGAFPVAYAHWPFNWPSDVVCAELFNTHRADFLKLVDMVHEDRVSGAIPSGPVRIDPSWGDPRSRDSETKKMSESRFAEYVRLFDKLGLRYGLTIGDKDEVKFDIACVGVLAIGKCSYKGITYKPNTGYFQVVESLEDDKLPKSGNSVIPGYYLKLIRSDWYIYRVESD